MNVNEIVTNAVDGKELYKLARDGGAGLTIWGLTANDLVGVVTIGYIIVKTTIEILKYIDYRRELLAAQKRKRKR
jgi:hypothetical protein